MGVVLGQSPASRCVLELCFLQANIQDRELLQTHGHCFAVNLLIDFYAALDDALIPFVCPKIYRS